ncbi:methyltransferase [Sulfodiicoccus acidiphilus]|uniref:Type II methyltransferase n=1 Tax=Sulfodiicoccus acidiphilus TaxID=1670455 RepID=A0A348B3D2_9CREN|nr:site-specific DNA-methyltransferase [Sulfodiicoccus acidiphilus]BBD72684.1 methyltransferase [Sulfodiicoccus acidiphilus]GGT95516.1 methyltransferase [Sulfodiicoccus acidiphilus]
MGKVIFGDSRDMREVSNESVGLVLSSPPYYNAPYDFPDLFRDYRSYISTLREVLFEVRRVLQRGRAAVFVVQDVRIDGELYPITADLISLAREIGLRYQDRIIWRKPEGYIRISRRSGVFVQHPYPLYFYPDNVYEDVLVFRKEGKPQLINREESKVDLNLFQREKWYLSVWELTNVLPSQRWSKFTAAFPEELAKRVITLYSCVGDVVLDPFLGTGTTAAVARALRRDFVGYEVDLELEEVIRERVGEAEVVKRSDAKRLRTTLKAAVTKRTPSDSSPSL